MLESFAWGLFASSSLLIGGVIALRFTVQRVVLASANSDAGFSWLWGGNVAVCPISVSFPRCFDVAATRRLRFVPH